MSKNNNILFISVLSILSIILIYFNWSYNIETQDQLVAHKAKAMVLTCMDFRLIDDVVKYLDKNGYNNNYDEYILAGASLGYNQNTYPDWSLTFQEHIDLALKLHHIKEIILIDHENCGAYKLLISNYESSKELEYHKFNLALAKNTLQQKYPNLKITTLFMKLNGEVIKL
jgi:carbonic anhydrase